MQSSDRRERWEKHTSSVSVSVSVSVSKDENVRICPGDAFQREPLSTDVTGFISSASRSSPSFPFGFSDFGKSGIDLRHCDQCLWGAAVSLGKAPPVTERGAASGSVLGNRLNRRDGVRAKARTAVRGEGPVGGGHCGGPGEAEGIGLSPEGTSGPCAARQEPCLKVCLAIWENQGWWGPGLPTLAVDGVQKPSTELRGHR